MKTPHPAGKTRSASKAKTKAKTNAKPTAKPKAKTKVKTKAITKPKARPATMKTAAFYTFIGAIEATIHFISTQTETGVEADTTSLSDVKSEKNLARKLKKLAVALTQRIVGDDRTTAFAAGTAAVARKVAHELVDLILVKDALLMAEARLTQSLRQSSQKQMVGRAWKEFFEALDQQGQLFFGAVGRLQANAPEWSAMDSRVAKLMQLYKAAALGGGQDDPPADSWGSYFGSGSSSSGP